MSQKANNLVIDKQTARRLILACQGLFPPRTFKGKAGVKKDKDIPCVKDAIASCPVSAIKF